MEMDRAEDAGPFFIPIGGGAEPGSDTARAWLDVFYGDERWRDIPGLETLLPALAFEALSFAGMNPRSHSVSLALLDDEGVRVLNSEFRGIDRATNVLSFPSGPMPQGRLAGADTIFCIGDIALALETVQREASTEGKPVLHHVAHLVVHGVLHLAGFDHGEDLAAQPMEEGERAILARFDIPDPYSEDTLPL